MFQHTIIIITNDAHGAVHYGDVHDGGGHDDVHDGEVAHLYQLQTLGPERQSADVEEAEKNL